MNEDILDLVGKTLTSAIEDKTENALTLTTSDGDVYRMDHSQDCCETVYLEDTNGDWEDVMGVPLLLAEEASCYSETDFGNLEWTFYRFATVKGYVNLTWRGESNGYYSTRVRVYKEAPGRKSGE